MVYLKCYKKNILLQLLNSDDECINRKRRLNNSHFSTWTIFSRIPPSSLELSSAPLWVAQSYFGKHCCDECRKTYLTVCTFEDVECPSSSWAIILFLVRIPAGLRGKSNGLSGGVVKQCDGGNSLDDIEWPIEFVPTTTSTRSRFTEEHSSFRIESSWTYSLIL